MMDNRLYRPEVIRRVMKKHGKRFAKSLGQNFLTSKQVLDEICEGAGLSKEDGVIEVGPGIGTLTQALCETAGKVVSIELDRSLIPVLAETMAEYDNFELINNDVLKVDLKQLIEEKFDGKKVKVAANLPYYITTPIVMRLLEERLNIETIVIMVQKEVAERMEAGPGTKTYGALSVAVQYYSNPSIVTIAPKEDFMPSPKVDSAVIKLDVLKEPAVKVKDEKLFFKVVAAAFGKRRKTLLNALSNSNLGVSKEDIKDALEKANIEDKRRGETLSLLEFAKLSDEIFLKI